jgi:hypothetical protein
MTLPCDTRAKELARRLLDLGGKGTWPAEGD